MIYRTHTCGELSQKQTGQKVHLSGWVHRRRDHGGLIFVDLRDRYGITQLLFDPKISLEAHQAASLLRNEWVISIEGTVRLRKPDQINPDLETGEIEISVQTFSLLSTSKPLPFSVCDENLDSNEELRLKYRYLDIRKGKIAKNLLLRHQALLVIRNILSEKGFVEITTPVLSKSTPEGARDYLVPSRIHPGHFYALPQSPQMFKQILMVSGMDKYFQIAPCFRDEDLRADRQPEFSQIDLEMSFENFETLFKIAEELIQKLFKTCLQVDISTPFLRMTHAECLKHYGTDKPDLRFGMLLIPIDDILLRSDFQLLKEELSKGSIAKAICVKNGALFSRKEIDDLELFVKKFGLQGLAWMKKTENGFSSNIVKYFSSPLLEELSCRCDIQVGDLLLIGVEQKERLNQALDHLRRFLARQKKLIPQNTFKFLWVTDFPLFSKDPETQKIQSEHHPFTAPHPEDLLLLEKNPLAVRAISYDLVLNGYELASGSQRIHDQNLQEKMFKLLNLSEQEISEKFGFFVEALSYGTPPHLGMALGVERLIMLLANTENIRDVVAFPKTQKGSDLMMQSPSSITTKQLKELHIDLSRKNLP